MPATPDTFANTAVATVAGGAGGLGTSLLGGDTTLILNSGGGATFPSTGPFMVALGTLSGTYELAKCTARSTDTLTLVRGQEGTTALTWTVGSTVQQVVTAGGMNDLWTTLNLGRPYNVKDYGAAGNGSTDDTAAIQRAITATQSGGGGIVFFPPGTYPISSTLVVNADNIELTGASWASQLLATTGFSGYMVQVQGPGGAGNFRYGIRLANLFVNGNNVTNSSGIDLVSTYASVIEHCRIRFIPGTSILYDGISGAFGAYNYLLNSHVTDGGATAVGVKTNNSEWLTVEGCEFGFFSGGTAVAALIQNLNCRIIGTSFDHNDIAVQQAFAGRLVVEGCQFDRGFTNFIYLQGAKNCTIGNNLFCTYSNTTVSSVIKADGANNGGNVIIGNTCTSSGWSSFALEPSGAGATPPNQYIGNEVGPYAFSCAGGIIRDNRGYNPVGHLTSPGFPVSASAYTNASGLDASVVVTGTSIAAILVGGFSTGLTSGMFRLPAYQTITVNYTGTPVWTWFGD